MCQFGMGKIPLICSMITPKSNTAMCDTVNFTIDEFAGKCDPLLLQSNWKHGNSLRAAIHLPKSSQTCLIGLKSGDQAVNYMVVIELYGHYMVIELYGAEDNLP